MLVLIVFVYLVGLISGQAPACDETACVLPDCRCSSTSIPGGFQATEIPQLVLFTFDDAVTSENYQKYFSPAFGGKINPDGCPIAATHFVAHEYSDYTVVNQLYSMGHEISLHSITHTTQTSYWKNLDLAGYISEFGGERELMSHFANIPTEDLQGLRVPFLQLGGNPSFQAIKDTGMLYDCSWPTQTFRNPGLWPYTLDYKSNQDCTVGPPCATDSIPGVWVMPMIDWNDNNGVVCAMADSCVNITSDAAGLLEFMKTNFNNHFNGNRAPFGFFIHAAWFYQHDERFEAYTQFIDYLQTIPEVYIVGIQRALQWVRNPNNLANLASSWPACQPNGPPSCTSNRCVLDKEGQERIMYSCASCPAKYPWLGNPLGEA